MGQKDAERKAGGAESGKHAAKDRKELLEETASDAAYSVGKCAAWNVSVDKFLGFCNLFCGDRRSCAVYQYHLSGGKGKKRFWL